MKGAYLVIKKFAKYFYYYFCLSKFFIAGKHRTRRHVETRGMGPRYCGGNGGHAGVSAVLAGEGQGRDRFQGHHRPGVEHHQGKHSECLS